MKILIVEDDLELANALKNLLIENGYKATILKQFDKASELIVSSGVDLVLLDINIPGMNGKQVLRQVRTQKQVPIIVLTSESSEINEVISMSYGADDFIKKPYNPQILLLRIEAVLNRTNGSETNVIVHKDMKIDVSNSSIELNGQKEVLSRNELSIITFLLKNRGKIVPRADIMDYMWSDDKFVDDNTLTVNINRLRHKLDEIGKHNIIQTRRSQGYIIE